jgi:hypothetical protein
MTMREMAKRGWFAIGIGGLCLLGGALLELFCVFGKTETALWSIPGAVMIAGIACFVFGFTTILISAISEMRGVDLDANHRARKRLRHEKTIMPVRTNVPIEGWVTWELRPHDEEALYSALVAGERWPRLRVLEASVSGDAGIQAFKDEASALELAEVVRQRGAISVVGRVVLWGKVIEHERGWRAERSYPLAFHAAFAADILIRVATLPEKLEVAYQCAGRLPAAETAIHG